jgi:hypothetical protein
MGTRGRSRRPPSLALRKSRRSLREERSRLEEAILSLERLARAAGGPPAVDERGGGAEGVGAATEVRLGKRR